MKDSYSPGQVIEVLAFPEKVLQLTVVRDVGFAVEVCRNAEYEAAKAIGRAPVCVAFRKDFILRSIDLKSSVKHNGQYEPPEQSRTSAGNPLLG